MGGCNSKSPSVNRVAVMNNPVDLGDQAAGPIVTVETTKRKFVEEFKEEEKKQVDEVPNDISPSVALTLYYIKEFEKKREKR